MASKAATEASRWSVAQGAVTITNTTLTLGDDSEYAERLAPLLETLGSENQLAMSFAVDQMMDIDPATLGSYDHWIVTDEGFLNTLAIPRDGLVPLSNTELPAQFAAEASSMLEFWGGGSSPDVSYYEWSGDGSFPALGSRARDGNAVTATNPIITVAADPYRQFNSELLLAPLSSNGQIVVTDADLLTAQIDAQGLAPYIASIDSLVDDLSASAMSYRQQASFAMISALVALIATIAVVVESARSWAGRNHMLIFARATAGASFHAITARPVSIEVATLAVATVVSFVLSAVSLHIDPVLLAATFAGLTVIVVLAGTAAYRRAASRCLAMSLHRRN